uniref:Uncharacterized protein n=1 Tax=Arundo donax TaxID=35708 RepID=A0A0A9HA92_ARUDO
MNLWGSFRAFMCIYVQKKLNILFCVHLAF